MKVLFISSGNTGKVGPIVQAQATSLQNEGIEVDMELVVGKGLWGYMKNIPRIRKRIHEKKYDVIHAHYSYCGFVATLAGGRNVIVSLMGSDVKANTKTLFLVKLFASQFWKKVIVKSEDMRASGDLRDAIVVPNGVDIQYFKPLEQLECRKRLGWDLKKQHVLFAASKSRTEKNYLLAERAFSSIHDLNLQLHTLENVPFAEMHYWHNAADVVLLTSLYEGSPNVIKEAMACNSPIVSTNVGDVKELFNSEPGHYLTDFNERTIAEGIKAALQFRKDFEFTNGRNRIVLLNLDEKQVAKKIISIYKDCKA